MEITLKPNSEQLEELFLGQLKDVYHTACGADSEEEVRLACLILLKYCMVVYDYEKWKLENEKRAIEYSFR